MAGQKTINEMDKKVTEGLEIARKATKDTKLLKLLDDLEFTWKQLCGNLIVVATGLSGMKYRTAEQIEEQLTNYFNVIHGINKPLKRVSAEDFFASC